MKKIYLKPEIEEVIFEEIMQIPLQSVGKTGSVPNEDDTNWEFGGDGSETDNPDAKTSAIIPDHFSNIWGDEEE